MSPRTADPKARRAQLTAAAAQVLASKGVRDTSVADIVKAAGVAQGTFYLYFSNKDEIVLAVAESVAEHIVQALTERLSDPSQSAVQRLSGLAEVLGGMAADPALSDLTDFIHRPENQPLHDRLEDYLTPALFTWMEQLVRDGIAEGSFHVDDPTLAAWFVLSGLHGLELAGTTTAELPAALQAATTLALRTLGATR